MSTWVSAKVHDVHTWSEGLATLSLDCPEFAFQPGQFVNLALDVAGERVKRAYSIASAPGAPLSFYLTRVDAGTLTPLLFERAPGDEVWVDTRAQGFFTLDWLPTTARDLWLVATGTGLGPFVSMWRSGRLWPRFDRVVVVHGVRRADQLAYRDELEQLARQRSELSYVPCVTRDVATAPVLSGRIPALFDSGALEDAASLRLDPNRSHLMLCGNPAMIRAVSEGLGRRGFVKHRRRSPGHISAETYW